MPRKQRFKPSRKPKPSLPNEEAPTSRPMSNPQSEVGNNQIDSDQPPRDEDSLAEPPDERLR